MYGIVYNEKWATDVTEFKIPETGKKLYLRVILDLYDRIPVAYVASCRNKAFQKKFQKQGIEQSMSRVGHCIDNGPTEGFWGIIKSEMSIRHTVGDLLPSN